MGDQAWLWPNFKHALYEDFDRLQSKTGPADVLIFSGDITQQGKAEEYARFNEILAEIRDMVQDTDGAKGFDARAWTSRWLREPVPALGGATPLEHMDTMEGQALVSETLARAQSGAYG